MGWIKLDAGFTNAGRVMGQDKFNIAVNASRQLVVSAKGVSLTFATTALSVDRWYHVAAVYDGSLGTGNLKIYLNGKNELATTNNVNGSLGVATDLKFTIAKNSASSSNYFRGFIDGVRVFNNALTDDILQKMVYQEVDASGTAIKGSVIPKDIEASAWVDLIAYYRMDNYKNDVIDDFIIPLIDDGSTNINFCRIYNVKSLRTQTAPMPFITTKTGAIDFAVNNPINFINGNDVIDANIRPIVKISHDVTSAVNRTDLGLIVDAGKKYTINGDAGLTNNWYLDLNGKIDLEGKAQLIQTITSDLAVSTTGSIDRDQQGTNNGYNYNYWSSPVSTTNNTAVNNGFTVGGILNDGINPVNFINYDSDGQLTNPVTLSENWIYRFQNQTNETANWEFMGSGGVFSVGQGFTMKGSNTLLASQNYTFIGKPNNAANGPFITIPIAPSNLNLCGNPFPSALNAVEFIKDNIPTGGNIGSSGAINGTLYFWQHSPSNNSHNLASYVGGYAARNLSGSLASTQPTGISGTIFEAVRPKIYIPVGQGFFVTGVATAGVRNITFKNSQREFIKEDNINSNILYKTSSSQPNNLDDNFEEPDLFKRVRLGYDNIANFHRQILLAFMENNADKD